MSYFTKDYLDFFKELAANNNKEWFNENKKRYTQNVKEPWETFIADVIKTVNKHDKATDITPKEAIFRINRDIRFSKDKTPYKLSTSAVVSPGGRKDMTAPGMYIEATPEHFRIYGGVHFCDKHQLESIRNAIVSDPKKLDKLMGDAKFKKIYGEVLGEKNKVLPKEFKESADAAPMIWNKQFYWYKDYPAKTITDKDLLKKVEEAYKAGEKLMMYFREAMN